MSIFSTYSTGENRVTASILAVLQSLSLGRIERLIGALLEQSEFSLVNFQNQVSKAGQSVPDAVISSSCRILIETKIKQGKAGEDQLRHHLKRLADASEQRLWLLVLTPDQSEPLVIDKIKDDRIVWASFAALDQAIDELLDTENKDVISEREAFLLRELQKMMLEEKLIGSTKEVVVVPAQHAWPEYERFHAYVCQPNRSFQAVKHIAFYSSGQIHPLVPTILETHESILLERGLHKKKLGVMVDGLIDAISFSGKHVGQRYKVMLLSPPDDPNTLSLDAPIVNDLLSKGGRTTAFTQNQRYVSLQRLKAARVTSDLVEDDKGK